ncbi:MULTISPECIES: hypothetical protein [Methylobacterium]|uniref:hypothetical protein n=1 Tax=Methylobacterium TaxID=407 RepID=UPI001053C536|nr:MULTISPECIES: hypothetical protein [Methylobacterium]MDR7039161.1 hypothetical protein [Methylobacterium sp. BE186]
MVVVGLALLAATVARPAADQVPEFDVRPSCHAATSLMTLDPKREKRCLDDEATARSEVARQWASFPGVERQRCAAEAQLNGMPSYVDLLECLTLAREAKAGAN